MEAGWDVALVVSQPDRKRGRGGRLRPTPVKAAAVELGLPVTDRVDEVLGAGADLGVVVAFGRLVRPHVLAEVPMVNLHFSLLPRWRGAAPVERAILAGDEETGVCLMRLEEGLDTGPVYAGERVRIGPEDTADELRARLVGVGIELLLTTLAAGLGAPVPQEG
ncbi:MAG: methionyl-tRNA formyltransferase, partial [Actinomycetota bacterium]|nr:methionyl-tRNA formyltransferase [Actinomycetota bacterium]